MVNIPVVQNLTDQTLTIQSWPEERIPASNKAPQRSWKPPRDTAWHQTKRFHPQAVWSPQAWRDGCTTLLSDGHLACPKLLNSMYYFNHATPSIPFVWRLLQKIAARQAVTRCKLVKRLIFCKSFPHNNIKHKIHCPEGLRSNVQYGV